MTEQHEREFRRFLEGIVYRGERLTEKGINTRVSKAKKAEQIIGCGLEQIVSNDGSMHDALVAISAIDENTHQAMSNALRKYYEMRRGLKFPRMRLYLEDRMRGW